MHFVRSIGKLNEMYNEEFVNYIYRCRKVLWKYLFDDWEEAQRLFSNLLEIYNACSWNGKTKSKA